MMPGISITKIHDPETASSVVAEQTELHLQNVRSRAFDYFENRGQIVGSDWDDWLRAEREVLWKPHAEMFENGNAIVLRVAVPGFGPKSIQVTATPHSLLVQSTETHQHGGMEERLHFCEFGQCIFRRFDLPTRIDPSAVSATLDKGILEIFAGIARRSEEERNTVTSVSASSLDPLETSEPCVLTD
jgi:HSP20 family molecular chaperone IbpA